MRISILTSTFFTFISIGAAVPVNEHEKRGSAEFDYVIIGGGTAGLTLANRLSEDKNTQVAVIEPGTLLALGNPGLGSAPGGDILYVGSDQSDLNPAIDWNFTTTPQPGANGRRLRYTKGKVLGGDSTRNLLIYQRGDRGSYQRWADDIGDDSYTFDNLLPYFKKSVQFTPPNTKLRASNASAEFNPAAFSSTGGPLQITYPNYPGPFSSYMEGGLNAIGIPTIPDFNSGDLLGAQYSTATIEAKTMMRETSQSSFLDAAKLRPNLRVHSLTQARKILFNAHKHATGVDIGLGRTLHARKEVILSAGAFHSPQLLMLSGIGPKHTLDKFNIPVLADRRGVGQNMHDHIFFGPAYRTNVETLTRIANDPIYAAAQFATDYTLFQRRPLTNHACDFLGLEKAPRDLLTPSAAAVLDAYPASWPDIEYLSAPGYIGNFGNVLAQQPKDGFQYAGILSALVAPLSRGNVTLLSPSIDDLPEINPNWLSDPTDISVAIAAFKRMRQAFATPALQAGLAEKKEYFPGPKVQTDEQILQYIRENMMTVWHAACTCKMGKVSDPDAVVDSKARVIGVKGLRVVDASAFALLPPGHPQSTVYALAEKIADEIRNTGV